MKLVRVTPVLAVVALLFAQADSALQRAIRKETLEGDLAGAIEGYKKLAQGRDRTVAAQALVRMGECYEKLGDAEARKAYERVVREFGDQKDPAATARTRLSALGRVEGIGHPAGMTLRKVWAIDTGWLEGSPSPDGRYLSFCDWDTGDLAVRDLVTGQNRRLTNKGTWGESEEYAQASVISGDGKQIAYAWYNKEKFHEVRVIGIDGSNPRTVYRDKEFGFWLEPCQWTADGKEVLVSLGKGDPRESRFALVPAAGGPARILPTRALRPWYPSLSPDGRFVVYMDKRAKGGRPEIFLLSIEGGREEPIVRQPLGGWWPVWTPDGKRIIFISDRTRTNGFWMIDVVDGKPRGIPRLLKDGLGQEIRPNGFTRQGAFYFSTSTSVVDVYVAELDLAVGKVVREPVPIVPRLAGSNSGPSWSPDGRRLAYFSRNVPKLMILSVDTGEAREVPVKLDRLYAGAIWLPDGNSVIVAALRTPTPDVLGNYRVDLQSGDHFFIRSFPAPVPGSGDISPDGKTHYWFTREEAKSGLGVIACDLATSEQREIARVPNVSGGEVPKLRVSPDSKHLAFRMPVDESRWTALLVLPAVGGKPRELHRFQLSQTLDSWFLQWTPDGRNLLFVRRTGKNGIPELWRIPVAGGESQRTGLSMEGMGNFSVHPDGRRIAFETGGGRRAPNELWVLENIPRAAGAK